MLILRYAQKNFLLLIEMVKGVASILKDLRNSTLSTGTAEVYNSVISYASIVPIQSLEFKDIKLYKVTWEWDPENVEERNTNYGPNVRMQKRTVLIMKLHQVLHLLGDKVGLYKKHSS